MPDSLFLLAISCDLVLDLSEVSLVDVDVVRFLLHCEMHGIRLAHCPAYVREWMVRENRAPRDEAL